VKPGGDLPRVSGGLRNRHRHSPLLSGYARSRSEKARRGATCLIASQTKGVLETFVLAKDRPRLHTSQLKEKGKRGSRGFFKTNQWSGGAFPGAFLDVEERNTPTSTLIHDTQLSANRLSKQGRRLREKVYQNINWEPTSKRTSEIETKKPQAKGIWAGDRSSRSKQ